MADDFIIDGEPVNRGSVGANSITDLPQKSTRFW